MGNKFLNINEDLYRVLKEFHSVDLLNYDNMPNGVNNEKDIIESIFSVIKKDYSAGYEEVETLFFSYPDEIMEFDIKDFPKFPNLKNLILVVSLKNLDFLDYFPNLESINLYTQWLDPSTKLNIKKPLENLKEIIFTESDFWEIVVKHYKLFPNIESFNFNSFGEVGEERVYINPTDLELFPKLKNVQLDKSSFYLFGGKNS